MQTTMSSEPGGNVAATAGPTLVVQRTVQVPGNAELIDSRIQVPTGARLVVTAYGSIWGGRWLTGEAPPEGWSWTEFGERFPLPGAHLYALCGRLADYPFEIGRYFETGWEGPQSTLFFFIQDDRVSDNTGAFMAVVQIWQSTAAQTQAARSQADYWGAATVPVTLGEQPGGTTEAPPPGM